jgi:hypothetical protein
LVQRKELEEKALLVEKVLEVFRTQKCKTVQELVSKIQKTDRTISTEEICEMIESLRDDGTLALIEPPIRGSFITYITRNPVVHFPFWAALAAVGLALFTIYLLPDAISNDGVWPMVRIITGSAAVLFIPGYGLSHLLFPSKDRNRSVITHLGLGFGLSLAIVPILWLILENSPPGARFDLVVLSMGVAGISFNFGAMYRQFLSRGKAAVLPSSTKTESTISDAAPESQSPLQEGSGIDQKIVKER